MVSCGVILLVNIELDIFHTDILGVVVLLKIKNLSVIGELAVNDVDVLDVQLALTIGLFFVDDAKYFSMRVTGLNQLSWMF